MSVKYLQYIVLLIVMYLSSATPGLAQEQDVDHSNNFAHIHPQWSPNGREILFYEWYSDRDAHTRIMVGELTTGNIRSITDDIYFNANPTYAGDGSKVVYLSLIHI